MRNDVTGLLNATPQLKKKRSKFRLCGLFRSNTESISSGSDSPINKASIPLGIVPQDPAEPHHLPTSFRSQSSLDSSRTLFHSPSDLPIKPTQIYCSPIHPASTFIDISDLAGIVNDLPPTKRPHQSKRGAEQTWQKSTRVDAWRNDCVIEEEIVEEEITNPNAGGALSGLFSEHRGSVSKEYQAKRDARAQREDGRAEIGEEESNRYGLEIAGRRPRNASHPPPLPQALAVGRPSTPPIVYNRRATPSPTPSAAAKRRNFPPRKTAPPVSVLPSLPPVEGEMGGGRNAQLPLSSNFTRSPTSADYRFPSRSTIFGHGLIPLRHDTSVNRTPTRHAINSPFDSAQTVPSLDSPPFARRRGNSSSTSGSEIASPLTESEAEFNSIGFLQSYSPTRTSPVHPFPRSPTYKPSPQRPFFPEAASTRSTASSSNFNFSIKDEDLFFSQPKMIYERAQRIADAGMEDDGARTTYQRANRQVPSLIKTSSLRGREKESDIVVGGRRVESRGMGEATAIRRAMVDGRNGRK